MSDMTGDAMEFTVYDGHLVSETPQGKSSTMQAIADFNPNNFFKSDALSKTKSKPRKNGRAKVK